MRDTKNNLLIFILANNGFKVDDGRKVVTTHTPLGKKIITELVGDGADVNMIQARFHKTRALRWEYIKQKSPVLAELEKEFGFKA